MEINDTHELVAAKLKITNEIIALQAERNQLLSIYSKRPTEEKKIELSDLEIRLKHLQLQLEQIRSILPPEALQKIADKQERC